MDMSVILPVMNEAENLRVLIPRLTALLDRERITHEIIVIDGPSTDGTREVARELARAWLKSANADMRAQ